MIIKSFYKKGITIFEILLAIAIVGILATMVLPGFAKIKKIQVLKSATEDVVSVIGKARSQTLSSLNSSEYGVHFASDEIVLFKGTSYSESDPNNQNIEIISQAIISSINLNDFGEDVYFNRLSGLPSTTGNVTVSVSEISPKIITISALGSASVN